MNWYLQIDHPLENYTRWELHWCTQDNVFFCVVCSQFGLSQLVYSRDPSFRASPGFARPTRLFSEVDSTVFTCPTYKPSQHTAIWRLMEEAILSSKGEKTEALISTVTMPNTSKALEINEVNIGLDLSCFIVWPAHQYKFKLRVDLADWSGETAHASYSTFTIANAAGGYCLSVGGYSGTAGDAMSSYSGQKFSARNVDQDVYGGNYATEFRGAWWYRDCHSSNLNSVYERATVPGYANTVVWDHWKGQYYSLKSTAMKIKLVPWRDHCWRRNFQYSEMSLLSFVCSEVVTCNLLTPGLDIVIRIWVYVCNYSHLFSHHNEGSPLPSRG